MTQNPRRVNPALLRNTGMLLLNDADPVQDERTIIVLGVARSGTSMVAGALHYLGVYMGKCVPPVYEDVALAGALEAKDFDRARQLIEERNGKFPVWGWKRPSAVEFIQDVESLFRNPEYIVVFRDLFAIANRNRISMLSDVFQDMERSLALYQRLVGFIKSTGRRTLLVSYEKAVAAPGATVSALAAFAGVSGPQRLERARLFVRPHPADYIQTSRITNGVGCLGPVTPQCISGWAFARGYPNPVKVSIEINGNEVAVVTADRPRKDILQRKLHPNGNCGFVLELSEESRIKQGDIVQARVLGDFKELTNSPVICKES